MTPTTHHTVVDVANVVIVTGATPLHPEAVAAVPPGTRVIAADGALDEAVASGVFPDVLVGDLDSVSDAGREWAAEHAVVMEHPADKDLTDTELALTVAADAEPQRITMLAGTGTRLDHTIAALGALGSPVLDEVPHVDGWFGADRIVIVRPGRPETIAVTEGATFSVLALHGACEGVDVGGARWPLRSAHLEPLSGRGVSNVANGPDVTVSVAAGRLTVIVPGEVA
ncbi:thiamine diphosphokinase [soil metagenome]